jgi:lincosamide nucleotidyltransferase A/C/D/E
MVTGGMSSTDVLHVLNNLVGAGCRVWVGGGWGVDALAGKQTRQHRDHDLALDSAQESVAIAVLTDQAFRIETDWRPARVELAAPGGRLVDLHPVVFGPTGDGVQADVNGGLFTYPAAGFVTGVIGGRVVPCLSIEQQITFHTGYEPRDVDLADLRLLHELAVSVRP